MVKSKMSDIAMVVGRLRWVGHIGRRPHLSMVVVRRLRVTRRAIRWSHWVLRSIQRTVEATGHLEIAPDRREGKAQIIEGTSTRPGESVGRRETAEVEAETGRDKNKTLELLGGRQGLVCLEKELCKSPKASK